ncbi:uncharacterized protein C7orf26 homolog [Argonauta hians]
MSNILKRLSYLDFPECTKEALLYLSRCLRKETGGIPGLGGGGEDYAVEVSRDFIHFACSPKRLTAIQELQLLEILCSYITDQKENERNSIFAIMFAGEAALLKVNLLTKLVSMAMSIKCTAVLDCTALWMLERGCDSEPVCYMAKSMVNDYCQLFPGVIPTFQALPSISPLFACNFIAAVTALFPCNSLDGMPPEKLVEHVTNWISSDSKLCSVSMRPASTGSGYRMFASHGCSPFPGLTNWCVKGPVLCLKATDNNKNCWGDAGANACNSNNRLQQQQQLFSRLHLGVLQSLLANNAASIAAASTGRTANSGLLSSNVPNATGHPFTPADIKKTSQELMDICKRYGLSPEEETCLCSVERLGQIIQVALASATLRVRPAQLCEILQLLPANRLLKLIKTLHQGNGSTV